MIAETAMTSDPLAAPGISLVSWDDGRLLVNAQFAAWLKSLGLTTAAAWLNLERGEVYREVGERVTSRHELPAEAPESGSAPRTVYLKRHGRLTWRERFKSYARLQAPVWGARPEWDAILEFHRLGIPTMTPIACAELDGRSCLVTDGLENCRRMDQWFVETAGCPEFRAERLAVIDRMAWLTRRMHQGGWHHQDLYWCHVLWPAGTGPDRLHIIDLGRVQPHSGLLSRRWIIKDLAQLQFASNSLTATEQLRFLRAYQNQPGFFIDRSLIPAILAKSARIARHTVRHGL